MNNGVLIQALNAGGGQSYVFSRERLCHWVLGFIKYNPNGRMYNINRGDFFEPTYQQKLAVLKEVGVWKESALEVMPPEDEVVDRENVYHLWEFQYPYSFIYNIRTIYDEPENFELEYQGIQYHIVTVGVVRYLYFKPKNKEEQVGWRKKQNLKNYVIGFEGTAVEIITDEMSDKAYGCLICFPRNEYLDFGLQ